MHLTICLGCGHPDYEHVQEGCTDLVYARRSEMPSLCPCKEFKGLPAADQPASCTEDRHIVLPSGEACACGENRSELLL